MKKPTQTSSNRTQPRAQPLTDDALRNVSGGSGEAYFVRCDRSTMTQN